MLAKYLNTDFLQEPGIILHMHAMTSLAFVIVKLRSYTRKMHLIRNRKGGPGQPYFCKKKSFRVMSPACPSVDGDNQLKATPPPGVHRSVCVLDVVEVLRVTIRGDNSDWMKRYLSVSIHVWS